MMLCRTLGPLVLVLMLFVFAQKGIWQGQFAFADESPEHAVESPANAAGTGDEDGGAVASSDAEEPAVAEGEGVPSAEAATGASAAGDLEEEASGEDAQAAEAGEPTQDDESGREADAERLSTVARSVVQVVVRSRNDEVRRVGSGFAVADGLVLTAAHVVADESRIVALPLATGAELVARVVASDEAADTALLRVSGLGLPAVTLAREGFTPGRRVTSMGGWNGEDRLSIGDERAVAFARGAVGQLEPMTSGDVEFQVIEHNAMIPAAGYGGPLVNDCGQVAGVNRGAPGVSRTRLRRGQAPEGVVVATGAGAIVALFGSTEATLVVSEEDCPDALEAAREEAVRAGTEASAERDRAERTEDDLGDALEQVEESAARLEEVQAQLEAARARLAELEREADEQPEDADGSGEDGGALQDALDEQRDLVARLEGLIRDREEQRRRSQRQLIVTIVSALAAVVLVVVVAVVLHRRRLRQVAAVQAAQQAALGSADTGGDRARTSAARFVLSGRTSDGQDVSLTLVDDQLELGVVIGRHPQRAGLVIADRTLSREHARLSYTDVTGGPRQLSVRDLGTTNGTSVNGRALSQGEEAAVRVDDTLGLGGVVLRVRGVDQ